jgi:hypothetical protein
VTAAGSSVRRVVCRNMADDRDPPPLFNNVDIEQRDDDNEDLFSSAVDVVYCDLLSHICMIFVSFSCHNTLTKYACVLLRVGNVRCKSF